MVIAGDQRVEVRDFTAGQLTADDFIFAGGGTTTTTPPASGNVIADTGNNVMTGAAGADVFTMAADGVKNEIHAFEDGTDQIDLSAWGIGFADLTINQNGAHVMVIAGDQRVEVRDFTADLLHADDFIFG